jgi:hypothetical protein
MANRVANQIWPNLPQSTRSEVERPVHRNALAERCIRVRSPNQPIHIAKVFLKGCAS